MEVGKLATSPAANGDSGARGCIFYFILDEEYPEEPRDGHQRYYYVVSASSSYVEAYCFLCHTLCSIRNAKAGAKVNYDSVANSANSDDVRASVDPNSTKVRQWYQLYNRVFGAIPYEQFVRQVHAAPRGNLSRNGSALHDPTALPLLFADESSARTALEHFQREVQAASAQSRPQQDQQEQQQQQHVGRQGSFHSARQPQASCTPERRPSARPATALGVHQFGDEGSKGKRSTSPRKPQDDAKKRNQGPSTPPSKPPNQPSGIAGAEVGILGGVTAGGGNVALRIAKDSPYAAAGRDELPSSDDRPYAHRHLPAQQLSGRKVDTLSTDRRGPGAAGDDSARVIQQLRGMIEDIKNKAEYESAQLRRDVQELKKLLKVERESRDGVVQEALQKERDTTMQRERQLQSGEVAALKAKLRTTEEQLASARSELESERDTAAKQVESWQAEVRQLQEKLRTQSKEHGERLHSVVKENQTAIDALDAQVRGREEQLKTLYEDSLQSRDVRITQLSESLMKAELANRQSQSQVTELQRRAAELEQQLRTRYGAADGQGSGQISERGVSMGPIGAGVSAADESLHWVHERGQLREHSRRLEYEVSRLTEEVRYLQREYNRAVSDLQEERYRSRRQSQSVFDSAATAAADRQLLRQYEQLETSYTRLLHEKKALEIDLHHSQAQNAQLQGDLATTAHLVQTLKEGLETVKKELPILRKEINLPITQS